MFSTDKYFARASALGLVDLVVPSRRGAPAIFDMRRFGGRANAHSVNSKASGVHRKNAQVLFSGGFLGPLCSCRDSDETIGPPADL